MYVSSHLLSCLVALPLFAAILAMTFPQGPNGGARGFALGAMAATLLLSLWAFWLFDPQNVALQLTETVAWIPAWGAQYAVGVDGLAMVMVLMTAVMTPLALIAGKSHAQGKEREYVVCMLMLQSMILGAFVAVDMLLFYLFWEGMLVPAYFLIGIFGGPKRVPSALRFFLYTMLGSMVMLAALIYVGLFASKGLQPSFYYPDVVARFAGQPVSYTELGLFIAFALAFAIKVPLVPLHGWLPMTYSDAPVSVTVMLSAVMVKVGAFGLLRYALLLFPRSATFMMPTLVVLAVVGILYGACMAYAQNSLKRILAYSSISHMGFIVLGLCSMAPDALLGGGLQMVNHAVSTGGLFILVGMIMRRQHTDELVHLGGMAKRTPMLAAAFVFMALSSMGLPGLNGFVGEFLILLGAFSSDGLSLSLSEGAVFQSTMALALLLATVLGYLAIRRLFAWGRSQAQGQSFPFGPVLMGVGAVTVLLGALVYPPVGAWPGGLLIQPLLPRMLSAMPFTDFMPVASVTATLGLVLGAVYLLTAVERTFFGPVTPTHAAASVGQDLTAQERWLLLPFVLAALVLGLYPAPLMHVLEPTMAHYAQQFRDQAGWPKAQLPHPDSGRGRLVPVGPGHLTPSDRRAP